MRALIMNNADSNCDSTYADRLTPLICMCTPPESKK